MKCTVQVLAALLFVQVSWAFSVHKSGNGIHGAEIKPFLTDGQDAFPGEFPYLASIEWGQPPLIKLKPLCGGSIISKSWILTSAQCVLLIPKLGQTKIKVGKHKTKEDNEWTQTSDIELRLVHSDYNMITRENDIALLKLKTPLNLNERVQAIELSSEKVEPDTEAVVTGWGSTSKTITIKNPDVLQKAEVEVIEQDLCNDALRALSQLIGVQEDQLCTGPLTKTISTCVGDVGSPLVKLSKEPKESEGDEGEGNVKLEQIGIVSWNVLPCGRNGAPSVYTRVSSFVNWIRERVNEVDYE